MRPSGRKLDEMRAVSIETGFTKHAEGSALIKMGDTHVLCTATIEDRVPPFIKGSGLGWVTAEYGMLPRATNTRMRREAASGKQGGRTVEIQPDFADLTHERETHLLRAGLPETAASMWPSPSSLPQTSAR